MLAQAQSNRKYQVALSFAGEDRPYVDQVAGELKQRGISVFYDFYEEASLWGKNLYDHLHHVYAYEAQFTVLFLSEAYARKLWTNHERQSAQERAFGESLEYVLPARFDDTDIPGVSKTIGYVDLRQKTPAQLAALLVEKLALVDDKLPIPEPSSEGAFPSATVIDFVSLLEPDEVSLEMFFDQLLSRASTIVRVTANTFQPPETPADKKRLTEHVAAMPITIQWPEPITRMAAAVRRMVVELRSYRSASSRFCGATHSQVADSLAHFGHAIAVFDDVLPHIPRRLPWLWLSVLDYSSPFPRSSLTIPHFVREYLRVASLFLYSLLFRTLREIEPPEPDHPGLHEMLLTNVPWQAGLSLFYEEPDDVVRAEVYRTPDLVFEEVSVYGPKFLTLEAYRASLANRPIYNGWFARYFVPQLELSLARKAAGTPTRYSERASLRKVVDLDGDELSLSGTKVQ